MPMADLDDLVLGFEAYSSKLLGKQIRVMTEAISWNEAILVANMRWSC